MYSSATSKLNNKTYRADDMVVMLTDVGKSCDKTSSYSDAGGIIL